MNNEHIFDIIGALRESEGTTKEKTPETLTLRFRTEVNGPHTEIMNKVLNRLTTGELLRLLMSDLRFVSYEDEGLWFTGRYGLWGTFDILVFNEEPWSKTRKRGFLFDNKKGEGINPVEIIPIYFDYDEKAAL